MSEGHDKQGLGVKCSPAASRDPSPSLMAVTSSHCPDSAEGSDSPSALMASTARGVASARAGESAGWVARGQAPQGLFTRTSSRCSLQSSTSPGLWAEPGHVADPQLLRAWCGAPG